MRILAMRFASVLVKVTRGIAVAVAFALAIDASCDITGLPDPTGCST